MHIEVGPEHMHCAVLSERGMRGTTYRVYLRIHGSLDSRGMVMDFSRAKRILKDLADALDHRVLLTAGDYSTSDGYITYSGFRIPASEVVVCRDVQEELEKFLDRIDFPDNVVRAEVVVEEIL